VDRGITYWPFTDRGRAGDHPNYGKRTAAAVQCIGRLCLDRVLDKEVAVAGHHLLLAHRALLPLAKRFVELAAGRTATRAYSGAGRE